MPLTIAQVQSSVLPTGAATSAKQPALGTAGTPSADVISVQGEAGMTALKVDGSAVTQPVSGTVAVSGTVPVSIGGTVTVSGTVTANAGTGTLAVSAASLPLPSGASTSAKQPALGVAGTPSSDVLTVQGAASMTALKVDGSGVTQPVSGTVSLSGTSPVSGTVTANQGGTWTVQPGNTANTTAWKVDGSAVTQPVSGTVGISGTVPVSGTVTANQGGTWTVQPGNTANTTAWKVDGSAVTQPVSGTVTANAGTGTMAVSAASLPLPSGAATSANQSTLGSQTTKINDGTNTAAVKAASTAAAATDPALVVAVSPNNSVAVTQATAASLNAAIVGTKTNNNAAPGATNVGVLDGVANAASPSWTETNQVALSVDLSGATRVIHRPLAYGSLGHYKLAQVIGLLATQAANGTLFSFRWGNASNLCVITSLRISLVQTAAATATIMPTYQVFWARSFSASDTSGTAVTLTGNNMKQRTSMGTTLVTDIRFSAAAAGLTAGTRTLDSAPVLTLLTNSTITTPNSTIYANDLDLDNRGVHPMVFAQNEGFIVRGPTVVFGAAGTANLVVEVGWAEVAGF